MSGASEFPDSVQNFLNIAAVSSPNFLEKIAAASKFPSIEISCDNVTIASRHFASQNMDAEHK